MTDKGLCMEEEEEYKISLKYNQENLMHRHHNLTLVQALSCSGGGGRVNLKKLFILTIPQLLHL